MSSKIIHRDFQRNHGMSDLNYHYRAIEEAMARIAEKPDAAGEVSAQSGATQARPTFSRPDLVAGFDNKVKQFDSIVKEPIYRRRSDLDV